MKRYILCLCIILSAYSTAFASYVVKGKGITSVMYIGGKAETSKCNDEIVYVVDLENKIVTRTGVFNADFKVTKEQWQELQRLYPELLR